MVTAIEETDAGWLSVATDLFPDQGQKENEQADQIKTQKT
jgi:hypothetical protein